MLEMVVVCALLAGSFGFSMGVLAGWVLCRVMVHYQMIGSHVQSDWKSSTSEEEVQQTTVRWASASSSQEREHGQPVVIVDGPCAEKYHRPSCDVLHKFRSRLKTFKPCLVCLSPDSGRKR